MEAPSNEGLSLRTAEDAKIEGLPIVDLEVTDDRIEGHVFSGTYESAVAEMRAFRPELFAREVEEDESKDDTGLEKRAGAPVSLLPLLCLLLREIVVGLTPPLQVKCNWGGRIGSWNQCIDGMVSLGRAGDKWCVVKPSSCARVSCSYNCGMFLCNKVRPQMRQVSSMYLGMR